MCLIEIARTIFGLSQRIEAAWKATEKGDHDRRIGGGIPLAPLGSITCWDGGRGGGLRLGGAMAKWSLRFRTGGV